MTDIRVKDLSDLHISGFDLFDDSEDFMVELSDDSNVMGGVAIPTIPDRSICAIYGGGTCGVPKDPFALGTCGISQKFSPIPFGLGF
jgi:hypothetical protein